MDVTSIVAVASGAAGLLFGAVGCVTGVKAIRYSRVQAEEASQTRLIEQRREHQAHRPELRAVFDMDGSQRNIPIVRLELVKPDGPLDIEVTLETPQGETQVVDGFPSLGGQPWLISRMCARDSLTQQLTVDRDRGGIFRLRCVCTARDGQRWEVLVVAELPAPFRIY